MAQRSISLEDLLYGEEPSTNRMRTAHKPDDSDSIQETLHNAVAAISAGNTINIKGYGRVAIQVTGTFTVTSAFEINVGGTWIAVGMISAHLAARTIVTAPPSGSGVYVLPADVTGDLLRLNISAYTSGSLTAISRKSPT